MDKDDSLIEAYGNTHSGELSKALKFLAVAGHPSPKEYSDDGVGLHKDIIDEMHDTYVAKNADYGNSFSEQYKEYGMLSLIIRLDDKQRRLKQLNKNEAKVKDESVEDTLLDMANYAIMGVMEIRRANESDSQKRE